MTRTTIQVDKNTRWNLTQIKEFEGMKSLDEVIINLITLYKKDKNPSKFPKPKSQLSKR